MKKTLTSKLFLLTVLAITAVANLFGQGTTNASIFGLATDEKGEALIGATVIAKHEPSGSVFGATTRDDGRYNLPNVRIGGPYTISCSYTGFETKEEKGVYLSLGQSFRQNFKVADMSTSLGEVVVLGNADGLMSSDRTGAATNIKEEQLNALPTLGRSLNDFLRLTPQGKSSAVASTTGNATSFAGQDGRFNNLTIDGSVFNNNFGLAGAPAGQTNSTPISLDAIEEIQVNLAPYDVRLAGFTGAGVNAVTKSGDNQFHGTAFYNFRNESLVRDSISVAGQTKKQAVPKGQFDIKQFGVSFGGPIKKDKLFYFVNFEGEQRDDPATNFRAYEGTDAWQANTDPNVTRVKKADLDEVKRLLGEKYGYDPGEYQDYANETRSYKALVKLDANINKTHRASFRFNYLKSFRDVNTSQSGSFQNRSGNQFAMNFQASNYVINNDIYSGILELNSTFGTKLSNQFQVGYTFNDDYRSSRGGIFPLVDILEGGRNYMTFGYEPFTPNNKLQSGTFQIKDDVSIYLGKNQITAGVNLEAFKFDNTFTPNYYGQYVFNSLADFKSALNGDSVSLRRYQLTSSALAGGALPTATTKAIIPSIYVQDELMLLGDKLKLTAGLRLDVPIFSQTALNNPRVDTMLFNNYALDGSFVKTQYKTDELPKAQYMFSPRLGFNYDLKGDRSIQVRGGTGVFTGRPAFVWVSNQVGNNGVLTGNFSEDNPAKGKYKFTDDVTAHIPANATLPSSFDVAFTDKNFKFPQVWRTNLGVDVKLPLGLVATVEGMLTRNINDVYYINANLESQTKSFTGADKRPFYPGLGLSGTALNNANRVNDAITTGILLKNSNDGFYRSFTAKLERPFKNGFYAMAAYTFAEAKDYISAGSIASSSFRDNFSVNGNNRPDLAYSNNDQRNRFIGTVSYKIKEGKNLATTFSLFVQSGNIGRTTLAYNGDYNGDQLTANDLLFVPNDANDLKFSTIQSIFTNPDNTKDTVRIFGAEQATALNALINGDKYLSENKDKYLSRNGLLLGWVSTIDFTVKQDFTVAISGRDHTFQIRADIANIGNMLNSDWGRRDFITNAFPINSAGKNSADEALVRFGSIGTDRKYTAPTTLRGVSNQLDDAWQAQIGLRYIF